jgi:cell division protein FtsZ
MMEPNGLDKYLGVVSQSGDMTGAGAGPESCKMQGHKVPDGQGVDPEVNSSHMSSAANSDSNSQVVSTDDAGSKEGLSSSDQPISGSAVGFEGEAMYRVLGVGGAGVQALQCLQDCLKSTGTAGLSLAALNTDALALSQSTIPIKRQIGSDLTRGLGSGGDPDQGRLAAEQAEATIRELVTGARVVFLLTGLGGGTGSGASPVVARIARECGALVLGVATLPFDFEGKLRARHATEGMEQLKQAADAVICVPNQRVFDGAEDKKIPLIEVFRKSNQLLSQGVMGLVQLLTQPGLIHLDFAHLESLLKGRHTQSTFATVQTQGDQRATDAFEALRRNPFLEGGEVLARANAVLLSVAGGDDLLISEVHWLLDQVQRLCDQAEVVVGTSVSPSLKGQLVLTVVVSRGDTAVKQLSNSPSVTADSADIGSALLASETDAPASTPPERESPITSLPPDGRLNFQSSEPENPFSVGKAPSRPSKPLIPPPPDLSPEEKQDWLRRHGGALRRKTPIQTTLKFEVVSKGRFEKTEATQFDGQNLDLPTYMRKGIPLN